MSKSKAAKIHTLAAYRAHLTRVVNALQDKSLPRSERSYLIGRKKELAAAVAKMGG